MDVYEAIKNYENALRDQLEIREIYGQQREAILSKVKDELDALETEMLPYLQGYANEVSKYDGEARRLVLELGKTVDGDKSQFVYSRGRVTWDGQTLQGMEAIIPEIGKAKRVGDPTVSIRAKK